MRNQEYYHSTLELLKKYSSQLNKMIEDGSFYCLPYFKRCLQIRQIKRLCNKLRGPIGDKKLISILAAASFLVLGVSCNVSTGVDGDKDPLEIAGNISGDAVHELNEVTLDGNGGFEVPPTVEQLEAVLAFFDESVEAGTLEGFGPGNSANGRLKALRNMIRSTRNLIEEELYDEAYVQLLDAYNRMDGDPKPPDFVTGEEVGDLRDMVLALLENGGVTPKVPSFAAAVVNPFGLTNVLYYGAPAFADLDGDGDMDLLVGEGAYYLSYGVYEANFQYFENDPTIPGVPAFKAPVQNPFGLTATTNTYLSPIVFADLDGDGDMDLLAGEAYLGARANFQYFENDPTIPGVPAFKAPVQNPFGLTDTLYCSFLTSADLDDDGDMDLLVGEYYGNFQYFENDPTIPGVPAFKAAVQNPFGLTAFTDNVIPTFVDLDMDGDMDILAGEGVYFYPGYYANFYYLQNTGTTNSPAFEAPVQNPFGLTGTLLNISLPAFADLDGDGDMDLLAGEYGGGFQYFENTTP